MRSMLVIDGLESLARLFARIFEKRGWYVVICGDRRSAIERLAGQKLYDVILLGHRVPEINAVELVRLARSFENRRLAAVVVMTASSEILRKAREEGADEVLLKPINPNALIWVVDKLVT